MYTIHSNKSSFALSFVVFIAAAMTCPLPAAWGIDFPGAPISDEIDKYLIVGMREKDIGVAVHIHDGEIGADQEVISNGVFDEDSGQRWGTYKGGLDLTDKFTPDPGAMVGDPNTNNRWNDIDPESPGDTVGIVDILPGSAPVFEGIDFTGNVALTSQTGTFTMSDVVPDTLT